MRLTHFVTWIPERRLSASDIIQAAGASASEARVFSQLFGFRHVAALDNGVPLASVFHRCSASYNASRHTPNARLMY